MKITLYHNPRCSKSRQALELLRSHGLDIDIVEYLHSPPDAATLSELLTRLDAGVDDIMRKNEDEYRASRDEIEQMSEAQRVEWLSRHPRVLQRPIAVRGTRARIGRPPEAVLELIDS